MSRRTIIAGLVGVAGSVAVAWGIRGLIVIGDCGGEGAPSCPPELMPYLITVGVGMPVTILAGVVGRTITAFALFPAVAVGALWAAADLPSGARTSALVIGGLFAAFTLAGSALLPLRRTARRSA